MDWVFCHMNNTLILSNMFIMYYVYEWINNIKYQIQKPDEKSVYLNKTYFFSFLSSSESNIPIIYPPHEFLLHIIHYFSSRQRYNGMHVV